MKKIVNVLCLFQVIFITFSCATKVQLKPVTLVENSQKDANELMLDHKYFVIAYDKTHNIAKWVKYTLTKDDLNGPGKRPSRFRADPYLQKLGLKIIKHEDYTNTGFARGHLAPAEDFSRTQEAIESTFVMSNVIPQKGSVNSGAWAQLEKKVRSWACGEENITVITGPIIEDGLTNLSAGVVVPNRFFKVIIDNTPPKKAIGFVYNQTDKGQNIIRNVLLVEKLKNNLGNEYYNSGLNQIKSTADTSVWIECR